MKHKKLIFSQWRYEHFRTRKKKFNKVYRTVQELEIHAFTEQSSTKFMELFIINIEFSIIFSECSAFYIEKFYKFCRTLFRKCLYPQLLKNSINFTNGNSNLQCETWWSTSELINMATVGLRTVLCILY